MRRVLIVNINYQPKYIYVMIAEIIVFESEREIFVKACKELDVRYEHVRTWLNEHAYNVEVKTPFVLFLLGKCVGIRIERDSIF